MMQSWDTVAQQSQKNISRVQMIPSHVTTARCSGACPGHVGQECRPVRSKVAEVEVMVVRTAFSTGMLDTACR